MPPQEKHKDDIAGSNGNGAVAAAVAADEESSDEEDNPPAAAPKPVGSWTSADSSSDEEETKPTPAPKPTPKPAPPVEEPARKKKKRKEQVCASDSFLMTSLQRPKLTVQCVRRRPWRSSPGRRRSGRSRCVLSRGSYLVQLLNLQSTNLAGRADPCCQILLRLVLPTTATMWRARVTHTDLKSLTSVFLRRL